MPLAGTESTWGPAVAAAVAAVDVSQTEPIDAAKIDELWTAITKAHITHLITFTVAGVLPGTFANAAGPVAGLGGPLT